MKVSKQSSTENIGEQIREKTGFILEHDVATLLEAKGWTVIHNRYYLDDMQAMQREIDLLAYKVDEIDEVLVYTSIIVSCKKSEHKDWIFLTRNTVGTMSNLDTSPFIYWSNSEELNFQLKGKKFAELSYCDRKQLSHINTFFDYSKTVFAFREYDSSSNNKKLVNDTAIHESILTLIKSQAYELESLPVRRKDAVCYYNINLLTVADVKKFIEIQCTDRNLEEFEINHINYVNRFLVNRREHNSRIVFTKFNMLEMVIDNFDLLHTANCEIVKTGLDTFYKTDICTNYHARQIIVSKHSDELSRKIRWGAYDELKLSDDDLDYITFTFVKSSKSWEVGLPLSEEVVNFLNNHGKTSKVTSEWFDKYFKTKADFKFVVNELPF